MRELLLALLLVLGSSSSAFAQTPPETTSEGRALEDPRVPGPGRIPVRVESTRGNFALGLGVVSPGNSPANPQFSRDPHARLCELPCTLHLRPGTHRLFGDAGTPYSWFTDLPLTERDTSVSLRLRGHLFGASAVAGPLFLVGVIAALAGPAAIIVRWATSDPVRPPELGVWLLGGGLFLGGAGSVLGSWRLLVFAAPRVEALQRQ